MTTKLLSGLLAFLLAFVSLGLPSAEATHIRVGSYAYTSRSANMYSGAGTGYTVRRTVPTGARVYVNAGPYNSSWYKVTYQSTTGYVNGTYLAQTRGQAIADTARRYLGYGGAKIGNTPSEGFSCVGFTQWVYRQHSIDIPEWLYGQYQKGWSVSRSQLRPGDLVFFKYTVPLSTINDPRMRMGPNGLSHVALYVGNGYVIHGTSRYGVTQKALSAFDPAKWYGARRLVN